jgi:hypothetical protein
MISIVILNKRTSIISIFNSNFNFKSTCNIDKLFVMFAILENKGLP